MFQFRTWIKSKEHPSNCYSCGGGKIGDKMTTIDFGGNCYNEPIKKSTKSLAQYMN